MFRTIMIPATLYPAVLRSIVGHFEDVHPGRRWASEELDDDKLQLMKGSHQRLGEVVAVLDQLSWTVIPREIAITAEGRLLRSVLAGAINDTLMAFTRALGTTITPSCDLGQFRLLTDQLADLIELVRPIQHDHGDVAGSPTAGGS